MGSEITNLAVMAKCFVFDRSVDSSIMSENGVDFKILIISWHPLSPITFVAIAVAFVLPKVSCDRTLETRSSILMTSLRWSAEANGRLCLMRKAARRISASFSLFVISPTSNVLLKMSVG